MGIVSLISISRPPPLFFWRSSRTADQLISTGKIPEIWHKAIIIPILKPDKDNSIGMNWRPISLLL